MQQEFILAAILTAMALLVGSALALSFLHWKAQRADRWAVYPGELKRRKPSEFQKRLILVGGLVGVFAYAAFSGAFSPTNSFDRIKEGCQREFAGRGQEYVNDCAIKLMIRKVNEIQQQKMDRAYR